MRTFLTYDYELFTGDVCGSVGNCLITPIMEIVEILEQYHIKATFFVDASFLYRLNELRHIYPSLQSQWLLITENIKNLNEKGHDIELHIHPQWYYSSFNGIQWIMDIKHFKLSDLDRQQVDIFVAKSKQLLEMIIGHAIHAFRAGGYSIQELDDYKEFFIKHELFIDSTVLSGMKYKSENQSYDYSNIPNKSIYRFDNNITKEDENGRVLELPITTYYVNKLEYLNHLLFQKRNAVILKRAGDGKAIVPIKNSLFTRSLRILQRDNYISASFDDANANMVQRIFERQHNKNKDLVIISHPKLHSQFSLLKMNEFLVNACDKTEFFTVKQLTNNI